MSNVWIKTGVRSWFAVAGRHNTAAHIRRLLDGYLALAGRMDAKSGTVPVRVPSMPGVDEDMRDWSFFQILEHNAIVNRSMTAIVEGLCRGQPPSGPGAIDPKRDVMPSADAGEEQVRAFRDSVEAHLEVVSGLGPLRGTLKSPHPLFGPFDAHRWHCMFRFHLMIHHRQAKWVVSELAGGK